MLAKKGVQVHERNLIKEPLTVEEVKKLAKRAGGAEHLIAPKRRADAEGLHGDELIAWLASDGGNLRRPIVDLDGKELTVGFATATQAELEKLL